MFCFYFEVEKRYICLAVWAQSFGPALRKGKPGKVTGPDAAPIEALQTDANATSSLIQELRTRIYDRRGQDVRRCCYERFVH